MAQENTIDVPLGGLTSISTYEHRLLDESPIDSEYVRRFHDCLDARNAEHEIDMHITEGINELNDEPAIAGRIKGVRLLLKPWIRDMGIGLVSFAQQPFDINNNPIDLNTLRDEFTRRLKNQTDGLVAAIKEGELRLLVGFGVSEGAEVLEDAGGNMDQLVATASTGPRALTLEKDPNRPKDQLIVPAGQMATFRFHLLDRTLLNKMVSEWGRNEISYKYLPGETDAHNSQRYRCQYRTQTWLGAMRATKAAK